MQDKRAAKSKGKNTSKFKDDRIKQYVGPADVLGRHDHVQLLPPLPLCAPFLGHQNSLPAKCRRNINVSPLPDDADEGEEAPPEG